MSKFADVTEYNETMQEWGYALVDLSPDEVKRGIDLSIETLAWPPEISEFIALARRCSDWRYASNAYKSFSKALPRPVNRDLAKSALADIRDIL